MIGCFYGLHVPYKMLTDIINHICLCGRSTHTCYLSNLFLALDKILIWMMMMMIMMMMMMMMMMTMMMLTI